MKKRIVWLVLAAVLVALAGCGGGNDNPVYATPPIGSTLEVDGDIFQPTVGPRVVSPVGENVLVGLTNSGEYRGFLTFPLDALPLNAFVRSATLTVTLVPPTDDIPLEMELVSFAPSAGLLESYYAGLPAYASARYSLPAPNSFNEISFNVTSLVDEAQRRSFDDFQVRIMENLDFNVLGLIEISEATGTRPRLTIVYE